MNGKQVRPRSDAAFCGVWSGSTLFTQACLSKYLGIYRKFPNSYAEVSLLFNFEGFEFIYSSSQEISH